ncbi:hypothetical protein VCHENC02_5723A, partial [Vibrio harveyi]|jgi:serine/threonine-protein phosphatase 2A regulatory subunit A
MRFF